MTLPRGPALVLAAGLAPSFARWAREQERTILRDGLPLGPGMLEFARSLGISDPSAIRVRILRPVPLPVPPRVVGFARRLGLPLFHPAGMALGKGIHLTAAGDSVLRHELVHVAQYERLGGIERFMRLYLAECMIHGYADAPLEQEARERS